MPTSFQSKRLQSIIIILFIALVAIGGLLFVMGRLAAPRISQANQAEVVQPALLTETIPISNQGQDHNRKDDEVAATVNGKVITQQAWDKAVRLDAVMNRLAGQPPVPAEKTLDQLINEIIILAGMPEVPLPAPAEIEKRTRTLIEIWHVSDEDATAALAEAGLTSADLTTRVGRLIQIQNALEQLAGQTDDLDAWLAEAHASAEIGLYRPLSQNSRPSAAEVAAQPKGAAQATLPPPIITQTEPAAIVKPFAPPPNMPVAPYVDNAAPDFSLPQLNGELLALSDFRGKPVIVNFWASWCPPCQKELPALQNTYTTYGDQIGFIAVNVKEDAGTVTNFIGTMDLSFPIVLDSNGEVSNILYEVRGIPTTVFVDTNGVVAARHVGPLDETTIAGYLAPLLEQAEQMVSTAAAIETSSALTMISADGLNPTPARQEQPVDPPPTVTLTLAPDFTTVSGQGDPVTLQDYRGRSNVVLVFYRGNT